jgi:hypothetical protein
MLQRSELETSRSPSQIQDLIDAVATDRETYPDEDVHQRRGILKVLLEEYLPLSILATNLPGVASARLLVQSNAGPDAVVELSHPGFPPELRVQITVADQDHQEALARELISQGKMVFRNTVKRRSASNRAVIEARGHVLTTPRARAQKRAEVIVAAYTRKVQKYRPATDALLIHVSGAVPPTSDFCWSSHVKQTLEQSGSNPYKWVFATSTPSALLSLVHP